MAPGDTTDAAIGWLLIVALSVGFYFGVTTLVRIFVRAMDEEHARRREERERIQEEEFEILRQEMLEFLEREERQG
jgi:hypothetical protein